MMVTPYPEKERWFDKLTMSGIYWITMSDHR